jgi:NitT/TauT family transport system substrate-binding protein
VVTLSVLSYVCSSLAVSTSAHAQSTGGDRTVTLILDYLPSGYHAPYFYGIKLGIFKKHGIDLEVTPGTGSASAIQAVATEKSMFGHADASTLIIAADKGVTGATVVYQYIQSFGAGVMVKATSGIKQPSDIAGHTVGNNVGAVTAAMFPLLMNKVGVSMDKVRLINIAPATLNSAFLGGQFDVAPTVAYDGFTVLTDAGNDLNLFLYRDYGLNILSSGIIASPETLKDRKLVKDFVAAMTESIEATRANPEAAAEANKAANPASAAVPTQVKQIRRALELTSRPSSVGRPLGYTTKADWEETVKILHDAGMVSGDIDVTKLFDNTFVDGSR